MQIIILGISLNMFKIMYYIGLYETYIIKIILIELLLGFESFKSINQTLIIHQNPLSAHSSFPPSSSRDQTQSL